MRCQVSYREKESINTINEGEYSCMGVFGYFGRPKGEDQQLGSGILYFCFWNLLLKIYTLRDREFYSINWCSC